MAAAAATAGINIIFRKNVNTMRSVETGACEAL